VASLYVNVRVTLTVVVHSLPPFIIIDPVGSVVSSPISSEKIDVL
jgi:hypothetical protein